MQSLINNIVFDSPESLFILGDFNDRCIHWNDNHQTSELGTKFVDLINTNNLFQLIDEPTHITATTTSTLDLIITDSPGYITLSGTDKPIGDPYHCLIFCHVNIPKPQKHTYSRMIWKYHLGNYENLNNQLNTAPWSTMDIFEDIDDAANYFKTIFLQLCKDNIPTK